MPSNRPPPGRYLSIGGGNLSGPLIAARPPALNMEVATKQYSDNSLSAYLPLSGGTMTGPVALAGVSTAPTAPTATNTTQIATTAYVKSQGYQTGNQTVTLTGDVTGSGATSIPATLAAVNANVGSFQGLTVNAKGLVTAAANMNYLTAPVSLTAQVSGILPVANGGTGLSAGTSGGVNYYSAAGTLASSAQLAANALVVGGGAGAAPSTNATWSLSGTNQIANASGSAAPPLNGAPGLQIIGGASNNAVVQLNTFAQFGSFQVWRADGTPAVPAALASGDRIGQFAVVGYNGSAYAGSNAGLIDFVTTQAWTTTANGTGIEFHTTANGATANAITMGLGTGGLGGLTVGAPTGGDKGAGTINAVSVYANGTLLTSDARLKRDIAPLSVDALGLVMAIEPKSFKHNAPLPALDTDEAVPAIPDAAWWDRTWWGFLADEVDSAITRAGHQWDGMVTDANGNQSLSYNDLIAVLWRAVQELQGQVADLRRRAEGAVTSGRQAVEGGAG